MPHASSDRIPSFRPTAVRMTCLTLPVLAVTTSWLEVFFCVLSGGKTKTGLVNKLTIWLYSTPQKTQTHRSANTRYISQTAWQFFWSARSRAAMYRWNPRKCLELPLANGAYCHSLIQGLIFLLCVPVSCICCYDLKSILLHPQNHDIQNTTWLGESWPTWANRFVLQPIDPEKIIGWFL